MMQKIIQVGNSLAVTLPIQFVRGAGWKAGDEILMEHDADKKIAIIKSKTEIGKKHLTPEFFTWLENISKKYEDAIIELAHR